MHIEVPHKATKAAAKKRVEDTLRQYRDKIAEHATIKKEEWDDNTLNFEVDLQGKTITGTLLVGDSAYTLDATLPLLWRMFEGRIEKEVEKRVKELY